MKTLRQLCVPRQSVFDRHRRDVVLDLTDLIEDRINASDFFEENYLTDGMKRLLQEAFRRFSGRSDQGVFVLTQAMGGGKTHNMVALGLLAKHPDLRRRVMSDLDGAAHTSTPVRVVALSGREEAPLGIWGAIAEQLGKREQFKDYYSPLSAPGQSAWVDLLRGEPLLILLDELPPYFENARSKPIGNSDLSVVTTTALSNLLVAVGKPGLANVCVVISDLKATYEDGSARINRALANFDNEVGRSAMMLEPVGSNTDEIYHILRKRLFTELPAEAEVDVVVKAYVQAVRDAKQMDITSASPEKFAQLLKASYPFHFAIRDLYARFRENPGFQQTRGLIRFMRVVVSRLFEDGGPADRLSLIHAHDVNLNDRETKAQVTQINPTLDNAISHDIASNGQAIAEIMDARLGGTEAQDACKLLLVASLASVPDAVLGLSLSEVASYLCAPGRDLSMLHKDILSELNTRAWYLHANRDGKLYFKNVQNLVAKLKSTAQAYNRESSLRELRTFMERAFAPSQLKDCYQEVLVLPPLDEIEITPDRVTLIVCAPSPGGGLHPDLLRFYADLTYPNRILFLSGAHGSLETLLETAAELKAIDFILEEMNAERVSESDPQHAAATDMRDKITLRLLSATRETFTTLTYPHGDKLMHADFQMQFTDNHYNGEKQIRETLKAKQKFTEDVASETFRKKCEQRLFTQKAMPWSEVIKRAATNPQWQWHRMDALDALKNDLVRKEQWREQGNYVEKPPFPKPHTDVRIQEVQRDDRTGTAILKLTPVHGDTLYYEVGGNATPASATVTDPRHFETQDLTVSFLCVDSKGEYNTGEPVTWQNRITIQSRTYQSGNDRMVELRATPAAPIRYTTDGSNPNLSGAVYEGPFVLPKHASIVLAGAETAGLVAEQHRLDVDAEGSDTVKIDPERPAIWKHKHKSETTQDTYTLLGQLKRFQASILGSQVSMVAGPHWLEFTSDDQLALDVTTLESTVESLREILPDGQITLEAFALRFPSGRQLLAWVEDARTELQPEEVEQP